MSTAADPFPELNLEDFPPLTLEVINQALEYHCHQIVNGVEEGVDQHWESLRFLSSFARGQQHSYGRIATRCRLAELVYYSSGKEIAVESDDDEEGDTTLAKWTAVEWKQLGKKLEKMARRCKRRDANKMMSSPEDEEPEDHERAKEERLFGEPLREVQRAISINKHLSHIRYEMHTWLHSNSRKQPHIDAKDMQDFWEDLKSLGEEDEEIYQFLRQFLTKDSREDKLVLAPMDELRDILLNDPCNLENLQAQILMLAMTWNNALFRTPTLVKVKDMEEKERADKEEEKKDDNDNHSYYQSDDQVDDRKPSARDDMRRRNRKLSARDEMWHASDTLKRTVRDPLEEVIEATSTLRPHQIKTEESENEGVEDTREGAASPKRGLSRNKDSRQKKKRTREHHDDDDDDDESEITEPSRQPQKHRKHPAAAAAKRRDDDDDEDEEQSEQSSRKQRRRAKDKRSKKKNSGYRLKFDDSDDEDVQSVRLTTLPKRRSRTPQQRQSRNRGAREPRKRKFWTEEEKNAIKEGISWFGHGKWSEIKEEFNVVLRDRTNVQIKDCARTMQNNGEIEGE